MFYNLRSKLALQKFNQSIAAITETPPIRMTEAPWSFVSMVANDDVPMYLLSMKAFYSRIGRGRIVAIIDRDMPGQTRAILRHHFPDIELHVLEDIDTHGCQRGGTWERLVFLLDRSAHEYVVQVDCDTLAVGPDLAEVVDCIERGVAFTLSDGCNIVPMREAAEAARDTVGSYVGLAVERLFDRYPGCDSLRYVRGSSGLAGFARGGFTSADIADFHREMEKLIGEQAWRKWGTEQCGSNFAVANTPGAVVLPYPAYTSFYPDGPRDEVKCFHFIGSYRFDDGFFAARGRERILELQRPVAQPA